MVSTKELRQSFLNFFEKRGHKIVPSSSLLPSDRTVLFTIAGMQQFALYLAGEKDPIQDFGTRHLASIQKCFRCIDIEKVGDDVHHTFFEMPGNWSIGQDPKTGYFKKGAIKYALEFFVDVLGFEKDRFWITVFKGEKGIPRDEESIQIWKKNGILKEHIKEFGIKDNIWGPVVDIGVCGPCSEIHYDRGKNFGCGGKNCEPNCPNCERFVELWNLVFIQYFRDEKGEYQPLSQKSVDTGIGFERVAAILQKKNSPYETDLFWPVIGEIERLGDKKYEEAKKNFRIIADHIRGSVFLIAEGVLPSNVEQGYVLRRILRRAIKFGKLLSLPENFLIPLAQKVIEIYKDIYPEILSKEADILTVIQKEEEKFSKALEKGIKEFKKVSKKGYITGEEIFRLYETYSIPSEQTEELARKYGVKFSKKGFEEAFKKHQEISRAGAEKKFGGVGIEKVKSQESKLKITKLHTATHLLHSALREILGDKVRQMGSDVSEERLRFDFSFDSKLTEEELRKVEDLVNQKIKEGLEVRKEEMSYQKAIESGALAFFKEKYPGRVTVYSIGEFSKEICAGPHVKKISELGRFKIVKEKSSGAGVRRIRAVLE